MPTLAEAPSAGEENGAGRAESNAGGTRQFVIFHIEDEMFALSLSEVQEIIRFPDIVRLPLSPRSLEGLANLRGTVLPVINLRDAFNFPTLAHDDSTRVVVLDRGHAVGLVVDRMANVVTVEADRIEAAETLGTLVDTDVLTGMIKAVDGRSMVMILDAKRLVQREFSAILDRAPSAARPVDGQKPNTDIQDERQADEDQLVSFEVAGQEYAFPIETVEEIVQMPAVVTHVPNAPGHVLGVITLRDRLLPLVSLRELFGLPAVRLTEANKVVVVSLGGDGRFSVGVVMDSVKEVLRVARSQVEPVPSLLGQAGPGNDIQAICRLQGGERLVSVLSAETMFDIRDLKEVVGATEDGMTTMEIDSGEPRDRIAADEEQFVVFRLMNEEYGVSIDAVQEIVRVPDQLTRIPNTPSFIEGVINLRGIVLPVIDQRRRFELATATRNDRQRIMVFTVRGARTGFVVDSVSEVIRIPASAIGAAPSLSGEQQRLIKRVANLAEQKRMILLLDVVELLNVGESEALTQAA